ncbi:MAG: ketopantoate reductase family protein [Halobellus sp.]|uniref:ketopantoate reductase family protein n=1 Tax=Halobellus sp. TaxID=1979212 RepID=UPI0035D4C313
MKIAVYGAGGVGGYLGGRLAEAGADVHLIARGGHLEALREDGLRVESVAGDFAVDVPVTDDPADVGPCEYVLFTVKSYDTEAAARDLNPLVGEDTAVLSLQNGVDNERLIADEVGREHVLGGVAYIFSTIAEPGVIDHTGGPTSFTVGELDGSHSERVERFVEWCERADGVSAEASTSIRAELWEKTAFICAHAGMTAATRLPLGDVRAHAESWEMYRQLFEEVCRVGRAAGVDLTDETVTEWMEFAEGLEGDSYSSLHYDLTQEKPMELDGLHGAVIRRAREHNVTVSMNEAIYAILRPWAARNERLDEA